MANEKELKAKIEKRKPGRKHEIGGVGKKKKLKVGAVGNFSYLFGEHLKLVI